jgi:hypothetical protein
MTQPPVLSAHSCTHTCLAPACATAPLHAMEPRGWYMCHGGTGGACMCHGHSWRPTLGPPCCGLCHGCSSRLSTSPCPRSTRLHCRHSSSVESGGGIAAAMVVTGRLVVESRRVEVGVSPIKVMTTILAGQAVGGPTLAVMILTTSHPGSALCCASHQFLRGCAQFDVQCMWSSTQHTCIELQCNAILIFQPRRASLIWMGCTDQPTTISWGALTNQLRF